MNKNMNFEMPAEKVEEFLNQLKSAVDSQWYAMPEKKRLKLLGSIGAAKEHTVRFKDEDFDLVLITLKILKDAVADE